jgi:hypothetical protein
VSPRSEHAVKDHSQFGQDAIVRRPFGMLDIRDGWCVEFGAWDGVHLSNTSSLESAPGSGPPAVGYR